MPGFAMPRRAWILLLSIGALGLASWRTPAAPAAAPAIAFEDVAERAGLHFVLQNSAAGDKHLIETMTGGVAVLDFDNDGWPDIYFVNGAAIPSLEKTGPEHHNRLFRNSGDGTFADVTARAGVAGEGYGMGAAAGDFDNDGFVDLFVAGVNRNLLFRNRGDGTFADVTEAAGLANLRYGGRKPWSVAAGWFDYDADGWLDLFVVNYVAWEFGRERFCGKAGEYRTYCHPRYYDPLPNTLYRNNRDGTFTDVSAESGIAAHRGKGMSVAFGDVDGDGLLDVVVTNDTVPNFLFRNLGNGQFREMAREAGVAFSDDGRAVSSMGVDFRDYDNDGRDDVFITALANETFPLFRNLGKGFFQDVTYVSGIGRATLPWSGWGAAIADFDNDGHKDVFAAAGDVQDNTERYSDRRSRQPNRLLRNSGKGTFVDVSDGAGESFQQAALHRGAALADVDRDGRLDVVVTRLQEPARLLRNVGASGHHWLGLRLVGRRATRDAIGARVRVVTGGGLEQWNHVTTAYSYASSGDRTVHVGLGPAASATVVEITWPGGRQQRLEGVRGSQVLVVQEP
jgi:enediyne biosynthesis protein E4